MDDSSKYPDRAPDCLKCEYFNVTWDRNFPRGCKVFGVKGKMLPSIAVFRATGQHCPSFVKSHRIKG